MAKVFIKRTRGLQKVSQVEAHAKYVGFRSKETKEKGFFGRDTDRADYKDFIKRIEENPALKHTSSIKAQKLIFSLKENDYEVYKKSGLDYKHLVRETLKKYEERHNVKLDWIANIHEAEGHPHCHIIIKGVSDIKGERGYTRIKFKKEDFQEMKKDFDKELEKEIDHERMDFEKTLNDITKSFDAVLKGISKELEKENEKAQMQREMFAKKEAEKDKGPERNR